MDKAISKEHRSARIQPSVSGATRPEADALAGGGTAFG